MSNFQLIILILSLVSFVLFINIFIYKRLIKVAIRKKIIPYLKQNNCEYIKLYSEGFFDKGNFKNDKSKWVYNQTGQSSISIYKQLFYKNQKGVTKHISIRIDTLFMIVTNVSYLPSIEDNEKT